MGGREDEDALPVVRGPEVSGAEVKGHGGVPGNPQVSPHLGHPLSPRDGAVFNDDGLGPEFPDDTVKLGPQPGLRSTQTGSTVVRWGEVVTRKATDDNPDTRKISASDFSDVSISLHFRVVFGENFLAVRVDLDLPLHFHVSEPGAQAVLESADACEEGADCRGHTPEGAPLVRAPRADVKGERYWISAPTDFTRSA